MKYIFLFGLVLSVIACNRQSRQELEKPKEQNATLTAFYASYGLETVLPDVTRLKNALSGNIYSEIKEDLDFEKVQLFSSSQTNELIYIVALKQKDKFYAVKVLNSKILTVQDELLYSNKMLDDKNGTIAILKNGEALAIEFKNGESRIQSLSKNEYSAHFMKNTFLSSFCQRESGQTFSECFKHEVDEFCDSFISCIAVATQPQVSIVIGIACSCNAS